MSRKGILAIAAMLLLAHVAAWAQTPERMRPLRIETPSGLVLPIGPIGPSPTEDSIMAQLNEAYAHYDNSSISVQEGERAAGAEIAARRADYYDTARLTEDVTRSGALGGRVLLMRRGTPLYSRDFANMPARIWNNAPPSPSRRMWCGAALPEDASAKGYCLINRGRGWESAPNDAQSPYAPGPLGHFIPISEVVVARDELAAGELPARAEIYRFESWGGNFVNLSHALRIGETELPLDAMRLASDASGAHLILGTLSINLVRGADARSAQVSVGPQDPDEVEANLRVTAEQLMHMGGH